MRMPQLNDNALNIEPNNLAQLLTLMDHLEYSSKCFAPFVLIMLFYDHPYIFAYIGQSNLGHMWYPTILISSYSICNKIRPKVTESIYHINSGWTRYYILVNFCTKYWFTVCLRIVHNFSSVDLPLKEPTASNMENGAHFAWWWKIQWKIQTDEVEIEM